MAAVGPVLFLLTLLFASLLGCDAFLFGLPAVVVCALGGLAGGSQG